MKCLVMAIAGTVPSKGGEYDLWLLASASPQSLLVGIFRQLLEALLFVSFPFSLNAMFNANKHDSLFQRSFALATAAPKSAFALAGAMGLLTALVDAALWFVGSGLSDVLIAMAAVGLPIWVSAEYIITMLMVERPPSLAGYARFGMTMFAMFVPFGIALAIGYFGPDYVDKSDVAVPFVIFLLSAVVFVVLMAAWPMSQAVSTNFVSPLKIFRASRGQRFNLFLLTSVTSGIAKLVPKIATARNYGEVVGLSLGHAFTATILNLLTAAIAASAWALASKNDPTLFGDR